MLNQIHIRDLATIEEQHLHLNHGTTMITGETGAGKSIFIEAIELALGARGSANIIRPGKERADISLCFDIATLPKVIDWLKNADLYHTDECIIRRVLTNDGRSRSYINGFPATLQLVRELAELLFHLHGQFEQQVLLKIENQRDILDRYAEHIPLMQDLKRLSNEWRSLDRDIKLMREQTRERTERQEYLRFQLNELLAIAIKAGEWEALETEHYKLTHSEELMRNLQSALHHLTDDDNRNAISLLNDMRKLLEAAQPLDPKSCEWLTTLNSSLIQLTDLEADLRGYCEATDLDPARLQFVEQRVSQIFDVARKHKVTPPELFHLQEQLTTELAMLDASDSELHELESQQKAVAIHYQTIAEKISKGRTAAAATLSKEITASIRSLSLPHGEFHILIEDDLHADFSPHGLEKITFLIKTNPDQKPQPIVKVISGGELSRLSLAVHLALANQATTPTLIFDEVETGVAGAIAEKIGRLLKKLGRSYQVFCVTHQAQVAACSDQHLFVEKYFVDNSTYTRLRFLNQEEKTFEIARMLGGETITQKTLDHAKEILTLA